MWPRGQPCGTVPAWSRDFSPATPAFSHHMAPYSYLLSPSATSLVGNNDIEDGVSSWSGRSAAGEPSPWGPPRDRHGGHGCIREPPFPSWGPRRASYPRAQVSPGEAGPALGGWGTRKASGRRVVTQGVRRSGSLGGAAPRPVAVHPPAFPLRVGEQSGRVVRLPRTFFFFLFKTHFLLGCGGRFCFFPDVKCFSISGQSSLPFNRESVSPPQLLTPP